MAVISKGSRRLLIVLSMLWFIAASVFVVVERKSINPFDQFDKKPAQYMFWQWSPIDLLQSQAQQQRKLVPRLAPIVGVYVIPLGCLWFLVWSFGWVREGFRG